MRRFFHITSRKRETNRRHCRGVTIVEVTVAMAIIAIVSFAAILVIHNALLTAREDAAHNDICYRAEAALECFKYAKDSNAFANCVTRNGLLTTNGGNAYIYSVGTTVLKVEVNYPENERPTFEAVGLDKNSKELFQIEYTKG